MKKLFYVYLMFFLIASCNSINESDQKTEATTEPASSEVTIASTDKPIHDPDVRP